MQCFALLMAVLQLGQFSGIHNQRVSQDILKLRKPILRMVCMQVNPSLLREEVPIDQEIPTIA
jgi:hypothetical protein